MIKNIYIQRKEDNCFFEVGAELISGEGKKLGIKVIKIEVEDDCVIIHRDNKTKYSYKGYPFSYESK